MHIITPFTLDRVCPGRYFADAMLFLNIASMLHVFNIKPPLDDYGQPIAIEPRMIDNFVSYVVASN